jgi:hypothetical protein
VDTHRIVETSRLEYFVDNRPTDVGALRAGRPLFPGKLILLISFRGSADHRAIVLLEGSG